MADTAMFLIGLKMVLVSSCEGCLSCSKYTAPRELPNTDMVD